MNLYRIEIESYKEALASRVEDIKEEIIELFGNNFEMNIAARSDGNTRKYYWRFKSSKRDRKYNRLNAESVVEYLTTIDDRRSLWLREVEEELIYINANLKLIKGMLDSIGQCQKEQRELREQKF